MLKEKYVVKESATKDVLKENLWSKKKCVLKKKPAVKEKICGQKICGQRKMCGQTKSAVKNQCSKKISAQRICAVKENVWSKKACAHRKNLRSKKTCAHRKMCGQRIRAVKSAVKKSMGLQICALRRYPKCGQAEKKMWSKLGAT